MTSQPLPLPNPPAPSLLFAIVAAVLVAGHAMAQDAVSPAWERVSTIFAASCAACHDWASTRSGILGQVVFSVPKLNAE
ncbi:MAG TPA: hypothetical protein VMV44_08825 [Rectinemataceae bacterium]|nr:hypothetical protein [Rectinemataceae bacterium]